MRKNMVIEKANIKQSESTTHTISVILPVMYKAKYLKDQIFSFINQSFNDLEVIISISSLSDLDEGVKQDLQNLLKSNKNIKLLEGVDSFQDAVNESISISSGKYILIVDSNVRFFDNAFEELNEAIQEGDPDIVIFGGVDTRHQSSVDIENISFLKTNQNISNNLMDPAANSIAIFEMADTLLSSKLFKKSLIQENSLTFNNGVPHLNDVFYWEALVLSDHIKVMDKCLFYLDPNSIYVEINKKYDPIVSIDILKTYKHWLIEKGIFQKYEKGYARLALSRIKNFIHSSKNEFDRYKILDYLSEGWFESFDLIGHAQNWYENDTAYFDSLHLQSAIRQWKKTRELNSVNSPKLICQRDQDLKPDVSIVIPCFNTAEYVSKTIASALNQTHHNIEIICIDDGSSDNTLEVLEKEAAKDNRIVVLSQNNTGPSRARNNGIKISTGKFVLFLDSDDLLIPETVSELLEKAMAEELDMLFFDADSFYDNEDLQDSHFAFLNSYHRYGDYGSVYNGASLLATFLMNNEYLTSPCMYLISNELLKNKEILFHEGIIHEDNGFSFACILNAKRTSHLPKSYYRRRVRSGSIMTSKKTFTNAYGLFACAKDMEKSYFKVCDSLTLDERAAASCLISEIEKQAIESYIALPPDEEWGEFGLGEDCFAFFRGVTMPALFAKNRQYEIDRILDSNTYKTGRKIAKIYHLLRGMKD